MTCFLFLNHQGIEININNSMIVGARPDVLPIIQAQYPIKYVVFCVFLVVLYITSSKCIYEKYVQYPAQCFIVQKNPRILYTNLPINYRFYK